MPFRSPQGEGRFESASARRLRMPILVCVCCNPASLNGFLTWRSSIRRRFERDWHRFRVRLSCFPLDCWPNLRENAFHEFLQRVVDKFLVARACVHFGRRSLGTYWGEKWRGGLQCRQCKPCLDPFSLDDRINKISRNVTQRFYSAARPIGFLLSVIVVSAPNPKCRRGSFEER